MDSRTPRFDEALNVSFEKTSPGARLCPETNEWWSLSSRELAKYKELRTPPSKIVPWAQSRRLRSSLGGSDFFQRTIEDGRMVITNHDPESPARLLPNQEWYAGRAQDLFLSHGREINPSQSFFEQWTKFSWSVPRPALIQDPKSEKSDWTSYCFESKNDYFGYNSYHATDCLYCEYGVSDTNDCDLTGCDRVEWSYDCTRSDDSSHIFWCERCTFSLNLYFCLNCVNCQDCFGCTNLKGKKYYFLNEPLTEEEYKKRLSAIDLSDHRVLMEWRKRIKWTYWDKAPRKAVIILNCEDVEGDDLLDCRDSTGVSLGSCERVYRSFGAFQTKDSCAVVSTVATERSVYSQNTEQAYENKMCSICISCIDIEYSELLSSCEHCFGCIGLQNKKYCIFNKQYTEEAYWKLVDAIKTNMLERGEYGEFFPYSSFFNAYNTSNGDIFFPLSETEAKKLRARWFDFKAYQEKTNAQTSAVVSELPYTLDAMTDELLSHAFRCERSGRLYRIVKPELEWHRKFRVALPRLHPTVRRKERAIELYPVFFENNTCDSCQVPIQTRIPRSRGYTLFCQACYEKMLLES